MRNILFRGKTLDDEWIYGSLVQCGGRNFVLQNENADVVSDGLRLVFPESVGQMTSYEDKNGTEIYEGDIIEDAWRPHQNRQLYVIVYDEICDGLVAYPIGDDNGVELFNLPTDIYTIVGNTTDNPELLRQ